MSNNTIENETDLCLIQHEKKKYWDCIFESVKRVTQILLTTFIVSFLCVLVIFYDEFFFKYFLPTLIVIGLAVWLSNTIYQMLVYKYFFTKRHRSKLYPKYMNELLTTFVLSFVFVIVVSLVSFYMNKYLLFSFAIVTILSTYSIVRKYKKVKMENPPLPHLSLNKALYREDFIEKYVNSLYYQNPLSEELTFIYYYLNVMLYEDNIKLVSLKDLNIFHKVYKGADKHIQDNNNQDLYEKIELRAILLKKELDRDNYKTILPEFFA